MTGNVARLGSAVRERRAELGISQVELWKAGGPSNSTLTNIETGQQMPIHPKTLRKLDAGLGWPPGHAYQLLHSSRSAFEPVDAPEALGVSADRPLSSALTNALLRDAEQATEALSLWERRIIGSPALVRRVQRSIETAVLTAYEAQDRSRG